MLTRNPSPGPVVAKASPAVRRRMLTHASLGIVGLSVATVLIVPKAIALAAEGIAVLGAGAAANLALVFGSLMFLREAQRARREPPAEADSTLPRQEN